MWSITRAGVRAAHYGRRSGFLVHKMPINFTWTICIANERIHLLDILIAGVE